MSSNVFHLKSRACRTATKVFQRCLPLASNMDVAWNENLKVLNGLCKTTVVDKTLLLPQKHEWELKRQQPWTAISPHQSGRASRWGLGSHVKCAISLASFWIGVSRFLLKVGWAQKMRSIFRKGLLWIDDCSLTQLWYILSCGWVTLHPAEHPESFPGFVYP